YRFLTLLRLRAPVPLLGALLLAFSGYMGIASSAYFPLAVAVFCFAAILFGMELYLQRGDWLVFVLALALLGVTNPFFIYLRAVSHRMPPGPHRRYRRYR